MICAAIIGRGHRGQHVVSSVQMRGGSQLMRFPPTSIERAEPEHFARQAAAGQPLVLPGGDVVHNMAVLDAIMASFASEAPVTLT